MNRESRICVHCLTTWLWRRRRFLRNIYALAVLALRGFAQSLLFKRNLTISFEGRTGMSGPKRNCCFVWREGRSSVNHRAVALRAAAKHSQRAHSKQCFEWGKKKACESSSNGALRHCAAFTGLLTFWSGDEARTRYLHLGKVALYRMSYARMRCRQKDGTLYKWCLRSESNQRHADFQSAALPTELQRHMCLLKLPAPATGPARRWRPRTGSNRRPPA